MTKRKLAYVWVNAGVYYVLEWGASQKRISHSKHFRRATRKARNLGYDVIVYSTYTIPKDGTCWGDGSYILPARA